MYLALLLDTWPALPTVLLALLAACLTFLATWYWKVYDAKQAAAKAESQAIADLKAKQTADILKMEGTIALVVNTIDRLTGTAEQVTTITERVAGQGRRLDDTHDELAELRATVVPQLAELKATVQHLRDVH